MKSKHSTLKALILSLVCLLVSCSMLVGSTFAWFSDRVASVNNVVKPGNLEVILEYTTDGVNWDEVLESEPVFSTPYWEPGTCEAIGFRVTNTGSLALKYDFSTLINSEVPGINVFDEAFKLSDYINVAYTEITDETGVAMDFESREQLIKNAQLSAFGEKYAVGRILETGESECFTIVVYMADDVENKANHLIGTTPPSIIFSVDLFATQASFEEDSFGADFDDTAPSQSAYVSDANTLKKAAANGENIEQLGDITAKATEGGYSVAGVVISKDQVYDGNGNTLTVTNADDDYGSGVYITGGTVKNLTVKGAFRGIFTAGGSGDILIENCVIDDVVYTWNSDDGSKKYGVTIKDTILNGWTSFSDAHKYVDFVGCTFGEGNGYAFCRPYNDCTFTDCKFEEGFAFDTVHADSIVFKNCYYGDTLITEDNAESLQIIDENDDPVRFFYKGIDSVTFK